VSLPSRSGPVRLRRRPPCGRRSNGRSWGASAREPPALRPRLGTWRRRGGRRPELPVPLAGSNRGDRIPANVPRVVADAGAGGGAVLRLRAPIGCPASVVHQLRLRRGAGPGAGVRPEDPLHPRFRDVPQLGDRVRARLRHPLDPSSDMALARLANRPGRGADRRGHLPGPLLRGPAHLPGRGVRLRRCQAGGVHRAGHRALEPADGPRHPRRCLPGRLCGDNSAHHPDPDVQGRGAVRTVPGPGNAARPLQPGSMNASDLLPGERILARSCRHWVVLLRPIATTVLAVAVLLAILALVPIAGELRLLLMLGTLLVGLGVINLYYWGWRAHEYVL